MRIPWGVHQLRVGLTFFIFLFLGFILISASASASEAKKSRLQAHLTVTTFKPSQVSSVKLVYKLTSKTHHFSYVLSKKNGTKWIQKAKHKTYSKHGLKGAHKITVKKLFRGHKITTGSYRLYLRSDKGNKALIFKILNKSLPPSGVEGVDPDKVANTGLPILSDISPTQDQTISATKGTWSGDIQSYSYIWQSCDEKGEGCQNLFGGDSAYYTVRPTDVGYTLRILVVAVGKNTVQAASKTTSVVPLENLTPPTINNLTPGWGYSIYAAIGTWTGDGNTYNYQWQRCDAVGQNCTNISYQTLVQTATSSGMMILGLR